MKSGKKETKPVPQTDAIVPLDPNPKIDKQLQKRVIQLDKQTDKQLLALTTTSIGETEILVFVLRQRFDRQKEIDGIKTWKGILEAVMPQQSVRTGQRLLARAMAALGEGEENQKFTTNVAIKAQAERLNTEIAKARTWLNAYLRAGSQPPAVPPKDIDKRAVDAVLKTDVTITDIGGKTTWSRKLGFKPSKEQIQNQTVMKRYLKDGPREKKYQAGWDKERIDEAIHALAIVEIDSVKKGDGRLWALPDQTVSYEALRLEVMRAEDWLREYLDNGERQIDFPPGENFSPYAQDIAVHNLGVVTSHRENDEVYWSLPSSQAEIVPAEPSTPAIEGTVVQMPKPQQVTVVINSGYRIYIHERELIFKSPPSPNWIQEDKKTHSVNLVIPVIPVAKTV